MFYLAETRMLFFYHYLADMSWEENPQILCGIPVAAFKTRVETLFYLIILFKVIAFVPCKDSSTES